ncbi:PTS glucose transporter subunit IIA [Flaviflexus huanghaiensis]|uniref:PTS glucose transporter subunit IIA n=1 Tax=Flaviflexus huanghaiensis TaxID=1111473 RepID=UPI0015FC4692
MNLYSPLSGTVLELESVPDPVFAQQLLGPGVAIEPSEPGIVTLVSPIAGTVTAARAHAVIIGPCLVHAGIDTFKSDALTCLTEVGTQVKVGTPLVTMDQEAMGDLPSVVLVTFPEHETGAWHQVVAPGSRVKPGTLLGTLD